MKKRQPKAYSLEFREEAMRQVQAGTTPIRRLAQELGVHVETLRNWRRDARIGAYEEPGPTPLARQALSPHGSPRVHAQRSTRAPTSSRGLRSAPPKKGFERSHVQQREWIGAKPRVVVRGPGFTPVP